ncbi:MAG: glycosyltransferase [Planctomycetota bacterium]
MTPPRIPIAFIGNEMPPYRRHLLECLAEGLSGVPGVELHCLFTHDPAMLSMPWEDDGTSPIRPVYFDDPIRHHDRREPRRERRLARRIADYLTQHGVRLVILHGYNDFCRRWLIRWADDRGLPLIVRGDSNILADGRLPAWKLLLKRLMLRPLLRRAAGTASMGRAGQAFFRFYADSDRPNFYLPCYPDLDAIRQAVQDVPTDWMMTQGLDPDRSRFLYSGRLVPHKGVDRLIDAFAEVAEGRPEWDLLICGDGPEGDTLQSRVPENLRGRVAWLGFQQFDGVCRAYAASDVLVHPSTFEPWGIVITEAMAAGLPVVATSVTGAAFELVEPGVNGELVEPGDHRSLVRAMAWASDPVRRDDLSEASRQRIEDWRRDMHPGRGVADIMHHFGLTSVAPTPTREGSRR